MSELIVYSEDVQRQLQTRDAQQITQQLQAIGVRLNNGSRMPRCTQGDSQEAILAAYRNDVDRIVRDNGFVSVTVISIDSDDVQQDRCDRNFSASTSTRNTGCASLSTAAAFSTSCRR